jgi:broad specificity phosphatase PhoE
LTLVLVRHGITAWNAEGRLQGQTDIPLAPKGREQALALGRRLADAWTRPPGNLPGPPTAVYTSDLSRACETTDLVLAPVRERLSCFAPAIHVTPLLRERHFGAWEGLTAEEARVRFGASRSHRDEGEPHLVVRERMQTILEQIKSDTQEAKRNRVVLVVGHGGSLRHLVCVATGLPVESARCFHLDNTGLSIIELTAQNTAIQLWNDTAHLFYDP